MATKRTRKSVGVSTMAFNIQEYLAEMRLEQQTAHIRLTERVDSGFTEVANRASKIANDLVAHEKKDEAALSDVTKALAPLKSLHGNIRWTLRAFIGAGIVAFVGLLFDLIHFHKIL